MITKLCFFLWGSHPIIPSPTIPRGFQKYTDHISNKCWLSQKYAMSASSFPFSSSRGHSLEKALQQHSFILSILSRCCDIERLVRRRNHYFYGCLDSSSVHSHKMSINWEIRPTRKEELEYCKCLITLTIHTCLTSYVTFHFWWGCHDAVSIFFSM